MAAVVDFRRGYGGLESRFYDAVIAPGTLAASRRLLGLVSAAAPSGGRVLDVGCGGGQALMALATTRPDLWVAGIDASPWLARRAATRTSLGARVQVASALALPYADASLDVAYSLFSVKHWPDRRRGLAECARVVRPGGRVLVADIDASSDLARWLAFVALTRLPRLLRRPYAAATLLPVVRRSMDPDALRRDAQGVGLGDLAVDADARLAVTWIIGTVPRR
jgi:ubiquinone/menaquinone biosynthesis C-methylase UbiE